MKDKRKISKSAQSILEYILVSFAFATVGIVAFLAANQAGFLTNLGTSDNYGSNTLIGQVLEDGIDDADRQWPDNWQGSDN